MAVDVPALLSKITQYGFRREEDFDKYEALSLAEQLASTAKVKSHEKAPTFDVIACTLREKLSVSKKQFKSYFVALLADKEYAKVLEAVSKVDKAFKVTSSAPSASSRQSGRSDREFTRGPRVYCYACGVPGHIARTCYRRNARYNFPKDGPKPLMPPPGGR